MPQNARLYIGPELGPLRLDKVQPQHLSSFTATTSQGCPEHGETYARAAATRTQLGHSQISLTMKTYSHLATESMQNVAERMEDACGSPTSER